MSGCALGGFAASLWVVLVYALGGDLSAHERVLLAGGGVAFVVALAATTYALEGIAARWRRKPCGAPGGAPRHTWMVGVHPVTSAARGPKERE